VESVEGWVYKTAVEIGQGKMKIWGECAASHCHSWEVCGVVVRELIKLSFRVVTEWVQALVYYMGVHVPQGKRRFGGVFSHWSEWRF